MPEPKVPRHVLRALLRALLGIPVDAPQPPRPRRRRKKREPAGAGKR